MQRSHSEEIFIKQSNLIYRLAPLAFVASIINSVLLVLLHWTRVPHSLLLSWLLFLLALNLLRVGLYYLYSADSQKREHSKYWVNIFITGMAATGIMWGSSSLFALFHNSEVHRITVVVVLAGMCAGAAATFSAMRVVYYSYVLPALIPQIVLLFYFSGAVNVAIAGMLFLFGILITISAETNYKMIISNFRLLFEREDLVKELTNEKSSRESVIAQLKIEVTRRKKTEQQLRMAHAELETKVQERTVQLHNVNEELQESEQIYRSIVETSQEGIWVLSKDHEVCYANKKVEALLGYTIDEIQGKDACEFLSEQERQFHGKERRDRGIRQKTLKKRDGTQIWVLSAESLLPVPVNGKGIYLGMLTDVTERRVWEKTIIDLNSRLTESNSELIAFTHSVSHDLRAPLRHIDGFTRILEESYCGSLESEGKKYISIIRNAVKRMEFMIEDLLLLSRVSATDISRSSVNLSLLITSILEAYRLREPQRKAEIIIQKDISVECDLRLIRVALENLFDNAWKFTSKNENTQIEFGLKYENDEPVYYISDNGAGFDMSRSSKMFEPFQRLHSEREFPGTGVGLATVNRVIKKHGGKIWAESEAGIGTTFYFTL